MEVYILDGLLRREEVVDRFESLIWTERWKEIGDFQVVLQSTPENRRRFVPGKRLAVTESLRVMTVETVEDVLDTEGRKTLKVKGRSLEATLEDRVVLAPDGSQWTFQATPENVARKMFADICVNNVSNPEDNLPFVVLNQTSFPEDTIPESELEVLWTQKYASLYSAIKDLCDIYDMGFRLYRNGDASQLFFNVFRGSDRTRKQIDLTPVIFSPELENLLNPTEFKTIEKTKNVAYVYGVHNEIGYWAVAIPDDVDPTVEGFERRVMYVEATLDDELLVDEIPGVLLRAGLDELAKIRAFTAFDGEISQYTQYKYGVDYYLGDLVTMQNADGLSNSMRVTEQIFVSDREGERAYPTLAINLSIQPGAWESWGYQAWEDVLLTEYWSNQP